MAIVYRGTVTVSSFSTVKRPSLADLIQQPVCPGCGILSHALQHEGDCWVHTGLAWEHTQRMREQAHAATTRGEREITGLVADAPSIVARAHEALSGGRPLEADEVTALASLVIARGMR